LKVGENAYIPILVPRLSSYALSDTLMVLYCTVAKVQPKHIHPCSDEAAYHVFAVASRSNCGDNFCSSVHADGVV
tara:strand:- start:659 stop:883 length:225 start_codon:yes stop_codon:yes gene_type:complete